MLVVIDFGTGIYGAVSNSFPQLLGPHIEILYMTNKMHLIKIFVINNALHVSDVYRPSSGAHELYVQLLVQVT
jgi:hypothetical protein